ncbi:UPF0687 protein C20orf27 homolog [Polypterus senegalus]|uniref:UPF0687 protein C20orf27 homolog n=1 Tax=Polypterus senegalus TaxID=55291 RepID=UPI001963C513|nr:UPF0687 protein C20orf27 homolog [Polypterus senegalus]
MAAVKKASKTKSGKVRFSEESAAASHVHFDEKLHDSVVMVIPQTDGNFLVKVGFLKIQHKYEIVFKLPEINSLGKDICAAPLPNTNLKVSKISPVPEGGLRLFCEYTAHKEGVIKDDIVLISETSEKGSVKVVIQARVMDRHHGTPMLLDGVRCIGAEPEYDSEQSDWQGFD